MTAKLPTSSTNLRRGIRPGRLFIVSAVCFGLTSAVASAGPTGYLVVRYDDYAPVSPYDRGDHGIEIEKQLFALIEADNARLTVGVIPFPVTGPDALPQHDPANLAPTGSWLSDPDNPWTRLLREYVDRGVVEPALHGFEHRRRSRPDHRPGEFEGQSLDWQRDAIAVGRDALSAAVGRPIRVFVPPWNAWDAAAAGALEVLDFTWLSPDLQHADFPDTAIRAAPQCTASPAEALAWAKNPANAMDKSVIVLVTHPFDFYGDNATRYFDELKSLLAFVNDSPDWKAVGLEDLPPDAPSQWNRRFREAVSWEHARTLLADLPGIGPLAAPAAAPFQPADWYAGRLPGLQWSFVAAMAMTALLTGWVATCILRRLPRARLISWIGGFASIALFVFLLVGASDISARGYRVRGIRWQAICGVGGALIGCSTVALGATRRRTAISDRSVCSSSDERCESPVGAK